MPGYGDALHLVLEVPLYGFPVFFALDSLGERRRAPAELPYVSQVSYGLGFAGGLLRVLVVLHDGCRGYASRDF